jgi:ribosomal protein S18 acetylase RimI-like enzyme
MKGLPWNAPIENLTVRRASLADTTALLSLILAHAEYEKCSASLTAATLEAILSAPSPDVLILVAAERESLAGYAAMTFDFSLWRAARWAHLDCLFVHAECRGQSVGQALFDAAVTSAKAAGVDRLEWQTPVWNEGAIRFYKRQNSRGIQKMRFAMSLQPTSESTIGRGLANPPKYRPR